MYPLIDSHCHLTDYLKRGELEGILDLAKEFGVHQMIAVGTDASDWKVYQDLAMRYPKQIFYAVGIHPCNVDATWERQAQLIAPFFADAVQPVALGEIGLDYFHLPSDEEERARTIAFQKEAFAMQLSLALQFDLPVIIHSRGAFDDIVEMIDESGVDWKKVVFHCFVEGPKQIGMLNERGGRGSFTGIITYKNGQSVRDAALAQGLDLIMIETDAPYLTPVPHRGKMENQPAYVRYVAEFCAELFGVSYDAFAEIATKNTRDFFGLSRGFSS